MKAPVLTAIAALFAVAFAALGVWQLRRAAEQEAQSQRFIAGAELPALDVLPEGSALEDMRYRRVTLAGRYVPEVQVLLDNMTHRGVAGYEVLTLFAPAAGGLSVVVNRGWLPGSPDRRRLPDVAVAASDRVVRARVRSLWVPALRLEDDAAAFATGPVKVMSFPRHADLERAMGRTLMPYQLLLDASEADGYVRAWAPPPERADRNRAYAAQWFLLAAAAGAGGISAAFGGARRRRDPA
jgi:surfeit locus 1 family protein